MSKWMTLVVDAGRVLDEAGRTVAVGQRLAVGLGSVELRQTRKAGLHAVRLSAHGRFTYAVGLHRDGEYRLGANYGFRVRTPEEETDPIKRVLREMGIPVGHLRVMAAGESLAVTQVARDIRLSPGAGTWDWRTDGRFVETGSVSTDREYCEDGTIEGASWALEVGQHCCLNGATPRGVWAVVVWPGCDPGTLADALAPLVYGGGADRHFREAEQSAEAAVAWVTDRYAVDLTRLRPGHPEEKPITGGGQAVARLMSRYGAAIEAALETSEVTAYRAALEDIEAAVAWVLERYELRPAPLTWLTERDRWFRDSCAVLQVCPKGSGRWYGQHYQAPEGGWTEYPLAGEMPKEVQHLLRVHYGQQDGARELQRRLFVLALAQAEPVAVAV